VYLQRPITGSGVVLKQIAGGLEISDVRQNLA